MIAFTPGPHDPKLGPVVYSKRPNYKYGYTIHAQGYGFYRVIAWFDLGGNTTNRVYQCKTRIGFYNAQETGDFAMHDLFMTYYPTSDTLKKRVTDANRTVDPA